MVFNNFKILQNDLLRAEKLIHFGFMETKNNIHYVIKLIHDKIINNNELISTLQ